MPEITYRQLAKAVADLAQDSARNADAINAEATRMSEEARATARVAEQIGALRVDKATVAETQQLSKIMDGLANTILTYAVAAQTTSRTAQTAHAANRTTHDGINEALHSSSVGREIYDVDRGWLTQE